MSQKKVILHVINALHFGGAESLLRDIIRFSDNRRFKHVVCYLRKYGEIGKQLEEQGIKLLFCKSLPRIGFFIRFKKILQNERPALVHTHVHLDNFWIATRKRATPKSRLICHVQNSHSHKGLLRRVRAIIYLRYTARQAFKMVAVSNGVQKHMMNYFGIPRRKLVVIPNAIDTGRFNPEKIITSRHPAFIRESQNTVILGSVGNISNQKDYGNLIHAVKIFSDKNPGTSIKVLIAGESSSLKKELERIVKELGLSNNTYFLGAIDWVPEFLKSIDIYIQSSKFEGLPCAVLEAMSMQKPVIATSVPGSEELIENKVTGFLVPPSHSQKLAKAIEEMISLGDKSSELGAAARKRVMQTYSIIPIVNRIQELYEAAVHQ